MISFVYIYLEGVDPRWSNTSLRFMTSNDLVANLAKLWVGAGIDDMTVGMVEIARERADDYPLIWRGATEPMKKMLEDLGKPPEDRVLGDIKPR